MSIRIKPKRTNVGGRVPTTSDIEIGEIAVNMVDKKIYTHEPNGTIIELSPTLSDSETRALFSASGDISYNSTTGEFTFTGTSGGTSYTDSDVETYLSGNNTVNIDIDGTLNANRLTVSKDGSSNGRALDAINTEYANSTLVDGTRSLYVDFSVEDSTGVKQLAVFDCGYDTTYGHDFGVYGALDGVTYLKAKKDETQLCGGHFKLKHWPGSGVSLINTDGEDLYFSQKVVAYGGFEVYTGEHTEVDTLEATGNTSLNTLEVTGATTTTGIVNAATHWDDSVTLSRENAGPALNIYQSNATAFADGDKSANILFGKATTGSETKYGGLLDVTIDETNGNTFNISVYHDGNSFSQYNAAQFGALSANLLVGKLTLDASGDDVEISATGDLYLNDNTIVKDDQLVMPSADSTSMPTGEDGGMVMVSNNSYKPAYFDGTDWRYVSDNTTV
jgi:hypothetical protein